MYPSSPVRLRQCPDAVVSPGLLASTSMNSTLPILAGIVSTIIFASSTLPMLRKAAVTKDLASYSLGNIGLANVGNLVHSIYVFSLLVGPIWALHSFYLVSTALMLFWYLRYSVIGVREPIHRGRSKMRGLPDASESPSFLA